MVKITIQSLGGIALGSVACLLLASCSGGEVKEPEIVRPAKLYVVKSASQRIDVSFPAIIEASESSILTFQVGGLLQSLPIREGQPLRKGAVIGRLDQRRYQNAVNSARAQYASAQSEYLSAARLLEEDAIARIVVDQRRAQRDVARASLDSAQKDLADTVLRAPYSGVIAEKHTTRFQNVQAKEDIVTLQSVTEVEAAVSVPASLVARLANIPPTEQYVVLSSAPDLKIQGQFRSATTQADTQSQTFQVKFAFSPPKQVAVLPGMTATVFVGRDLLASEGSTDSITIPIGAIQSNGEERYVWVVNKKAMTVKKRVVLVNKDAGEEIAVRGGLKAGETIVAAGAAYLHEGMKIRPYTP